MRLELQFGITAPPMSEQLKDTPLPDGTIARIQTMAYGLVLLGIHGITTESERHKARKRLVQYIKREIARRADPERFEDIVARAIKNIDIIELSPEFAKVVAEAMDNPRPINERLQKALNDLDS